MISKSLWAVVFVITWCSTIYHIFYCKSNLFRELLMRKNVSTFILRFNAQENLQGYNCSNAQASPFLQDAFPVPKLGKINLNHNVNLIYLLFTTKVLNK